MDSLVTLTEIYKTNEQGTVKDQKYALREVIVNPDHIFALRYDTKLANLHDKSQLPKDLDPRQEYTRIYFNSLNHGIIVVVGDLHVVKRRLLGDIK